MATILIIDDHADVRMLIKQALKFGDYEIFEASDAQMGMKMVRAIRPNLVILDIHMPLMLEISEPSIFDGMDLCRSLKSNPDYIDIPIIMLSGSAKLDVIEMARTAGADEFIAKPFSVINLIEVVSSLVSKQFSYV